jgi:uncharacterized iron-regulated protein
MADVVRRAEGADLVVFGELHSHPVGARFEKELLEALVRAERPVALALEFFEADAQPALDAYLGGTSERAAFVEATKRPGDYDQTHGPLVDHAKESGAAVIAANAPRALVTAFRKAEGDYATWRASLSAEEQALVPRTSHEIRDDAYWRAFQGLMGERATTFFRAQSLWDDAMAERVADHRTAHPEDRVMLVIGAFHVTGGLGTLTKYRERRPGDRVFVLLMRAGERGPLPFAPDDRGTADVVLKVPPAPESP